MTSPQPLCLEKFCAGKPGRANFSLRRGEGLKYLEISTKKEGLEASLLAGERFGEGFF
jgi:hypothetical protein